MQSKFDIKTLREKSGMTQEELAKKANVNRSLLNQLETGKLTKTSTNTLEKLAKALNCDVRDFF